MVIGNVAQKLANASPTITTSQKRNATQIRMLVTTKTTVLNKGDFLPATEVARVAGFGSTNLSLQPKNWKRNREIFAIQYGREDYLQRYGLNPTDHHPGKEMAEILKIFGDAKDESGLSGSER